MRNNDLRAAAIGTTAGALTIAAMIAWVEADASVRIGTALARARMTPAERRECDELRDLAARDREYTDRNAVKITFPSAREKLSPSQLAELEAMNSADLLNETAKTHAALNKRTGTYESGRWAAAYDHMQALSSEVAHRFANGHLSPLDRARLALAQRYIYGGATGLLPELRERGERV